MIHATVGARGRTPDTRTHRRHDSAERQVYIIPTNLLPTAGEVEDESLIKEQTDRIYTEEQLYNHRGGPIRSLEPQRSSLYSRKSVFQAHVALMRKNCKVHDHISSIKNVCNSYMQADL
ncbi:hypothetical protein EVAR_98554_1 [Eumeta japonica]|uniref:Uncharacterized protein n=1 Tax=Eumeta variegata TaxID=151549 RepID=A0A4C1YL46_EUMVA|nr:hypothetical protein EVAR_98554_1 [Eumeta japonica]